MSKQAFLERTRELIARGEEISAAPAWDAFRFWLLESDEFLESVWGRMDRYHLAWLNVGRDSQPPGSPLDTEGERRFIGEVAAAKLGVLRTMLTAIERRGSPLFTDAPA
ncbi:MAG: hypothetical protein ABR509_00775 [Candidatus Limnocylindria bacterium]